MATSSYYPGGSASATEYTTLPELLTQLPDNTGNLIDAVNVRNSVYTLWEKISNVQKQLDLTKQYKQGLLQQMFI